MSVTLTKTEETLYPVKDIKKRFYDPYHKVKQGIG